jgi:hypothetical protein
MKPVQVCDLQRQRNNVQEVIDEIEREQAAAMAPTIRQYKGDVEKVVSSPTPYPLPYKILK